MQPELQDNKPVRSLFRRVWDALSRRPFTKLAALLLAFIFWAVVIASDPALTIEKIITDATVTVSSTVALENRGYIVMKDLTAEPITVKLRVEVKQGDYERATAQSFSPRLDLSQINGTGTFDVKFSAYSDLGKVLSIEPETIRLEVDAYTPPTRVPVVIEQSGDPSEPIWFADPTSDPRQVYVSGPKSLVDRINRAAVTLPVASLSAERPSDNLTLPITLRDESGQAVSSPLLRVTNESVNIDFVNLHVDVYPVRDIPISLDTAYTGVPAHGYAVGDVTLSPATVQVAAKKDVLDALEALHLSTPPDISGQSAAQIITSSIKGLTGMAHVSASEAELKVDIVPAQHTHTYGDLPVTTMGAAAGLTATLSRESMSAVISGAYQAVEPLKPGDLHLYVDATGLGEGQHTVDVKIRVDGTDAYTFEPEAAELLLTLTKAGGS